MLTIPMDINAHKLIPCEDPSRVSVPQKATHILPQSPATYTDHLLIGRLAQAQKNQEILVALLIEHC